VQAFSPKEPVALETLPASSTLAAVLAQDLRAAAASPYLGAAMATGLPAATGFSPEAVVQAFASDEPVALDTLPGGSALLAALARLETGQSQSVQDAAAQKAAEEAAKAEEKRLKLAAARQTLQDVFGDTLPVLDDTVVEATDLSSLAALRYSPAGQSLFDVIGWAENANARQQQAQTAAQQALEQQVAGKIAALGWPADLTQLVATETDQSVRDAFFALMPVEALSDLYLSEALDALPGLK
jgi:hypothetical protein